MRYNTLVRSLFVLVVVLVLGYSNKKPNEEGFED